MAEENFIQRLVGEFKTGVDAIHGLCIESRRSAVRRQNPRKTSIADVPSSTRSPFYSLPTNSELFARFRPSFGEMPHPENHSRQQTRACPSSELRRITPKAPSLPYRRLRSRFTGDQGLKVVKSDFTELDDKTKPVDERTSSPARSSDEPFSSPSTTNASQDWETETLCSSCFSHAYASNDCESPTHQLKPITDQERRKSADHDYFPRSMDESRNLNRSKSLPDLAKPKLRRVTRVDDLFLASNGVSKSSYQSEAADSDDMKWRKQSSLRVD